MVGCASPVPRNHFHATLRMPERSSTTTQPWGKTRLAFARRTTGTSTPSALSSKRPVVKPSVTIVADVPSPFQNVFFDAVARRGEVDLEVVFCRASVAYRSAWHGSRPRLARYK